MSFIVYSAMVTSDTKIENVETSSTTTTKRQTEGLAYPPDAFCNTCRWIADSKYTCGKRAEFLVSRYKMTENQAISSLFDQGTCIDPSYVATSKEDQVDDHIIINDTVATAVENNSNIMFTVAEDAKAGYSSSIISYMIATLIVIIILIQKRMRNNDSLKKNISQLSLSLSPNEGDVAGVTSGGVGGISIPTVLSLLMTVLIAYNSMNNLDYSDETKTSTSDIKRVSNNIIVTKDTKYWTTSRNPHKKNLPPGVRISFQLRNTGEFHIKTDEPCYKNAEDSQRGWNRTSKLPPTLIDTWTANDWANKTNNTITYTDIYGRILDFSTSVATDLKILFLGDSVAVQFAEGFDSAASGIPMGSALSFAKEVDGVNDTYLSSLPPNPRHQIESFMKTRACTFSSGPIRGGGGIGLWRVVKLISMSRMGGAVWCVLWLI